GKTAGAVKHEADRECACGRAESEAGMSREDRAHLPAADQLVDRFVYVAAEKAPPPKRQIVHAVRNEKVCHIEVRWTAANAQVGRVADLSSGHRVGYARDVIDRARKCVIEIELKAVRVIFCQAQQQAV